MKFSATLISSALLASTVMAAPLTERRRARAAARLASRRSAPMIKANGTVEGTISQDTEYSENWAGAALVGSGYTAVTGTFTVPTPSVPSGDSSSSSYYASAWVGIDGDTCQTSILQTGVDFNIEDGEVSFDCWYEWYPAYAYDFTGITISAGDVIKTTVTATSTSSGTAVIENETTGVTVSHTFTNQEDELCEENAEWIVEDFTEDDDLVPFADFGTVTFTDAEATTSSGTVTPADADIILIEQDNEVLTSVTVSGSTVTIKYV